MLETVNVSVNLMESHPCRAQNLQNPAKNVKPNPHPAPTSGSA
jgi:hypothetical protein